MIMFRGRGSYHVRKWAIANDFQRWQRWILGPRVQQRIDTLLYRKTTHEDYIFPGSVRKAEIGLNKVWLDGNTFGGQASLHELLTAEFCKCDESIDFIVQCAEKAMCSRHCDERRGRGTTFAVARM